VIFCRGVLSPHFARPISVGPVKPFLRIIIYFKRDPALNSGCRMVPNTCQMYLRARQIKNASFPYNIYSTKYDLVDENTKIYVSGIVGSLMHVIVINCSFYGLNFKHSLPLNYR
jgi:hypothetical protein